MHQVTVAVIEMAIFWKRYGPEEIVQVGIYGNKTNNKQYVSKSFATQTSPQELFLSVGRPNGWKGSFDVEATPP